MEYENEDVEVTSSHASRMLIETRIKWGLVFDVTWLSKQKGIERKGKYIILIKVSRKTRHGLERWLSSQNACHASIRN